MRTVKLYSFALSHPSMAVRKMLELKSIPVETVNVLPGMQRIHLRLVGFRGGTVPAIKVAGRRVQGSREIARALDQLAPEPPLFPSEPDLRVRVEEAERWGEEELQNAPRVLMRWGLVRDLGLRRWLAEQSRVPAPAIAARTSGPTARYYAHVVGADDAGARETLARLPALLDRADGLLADGTLGPDSPNAAALQVLSSVRSLAAFSDLRGQMAGRPSTVAARAIFPSFPEPVPAFIPPDWVVHAPRLGL